MASHPCEVAPPLPPLVAGHHLLHQPGRELQVALCERLGGTQNVRLLRRALLSLRQLGLGHHLLQHPGGDSKTLMRLVLADAPSVLSDGCILAMLLLPGRLLRTPGHFGRQKRHLFDYPLGLSLYLVLVHALYRLRRSVLSEH